MHNEQKYDATKIGKQLKKDFPTSTIISEVLVDVYNRNKNSSDLTREEESIKQNDPESLYGLILKYYDAYNKEDYTEAEKLLHKRTDMYGITENTAEKQMYIYIKKNDVEKLLKFIPECANKYPHNFTFFNTNYALMLEVYKDKSKAMKMLENFTKRHFSEDLIEKLVEAKIDDGQKNDGMKLLLKLIEDKPYATMRYTSIAKRYFENKDYKKALEWVQKTIDRAPYVGSIVKEKAAIYEFDGNKTEAINYYKTALKYNPQDYQTRKKINELEGKKDLASNFKTNDVTALFSNSPSQKDYPNSNSIYLLKDEQQIIYPENGASEEFYDYLIKIVNQDGIKTWKEVSIPYNSYRQRLIFDKVELLKKDGTKVQAETSDNQAVFSTLDVDDAIHIKYKIENRSYGKLAEHFWSNFSFDGDYPTVTARFSLLVSSNKKFEYKTFNTSVKPQITNLDGGNTLYVWEENKMKEIEPETNMPSYSDLTKLLVISSIPDWNYVANWYSDLSNVKSKADFDIKETVKDLFKDKKNLTNIEKARTIYNYLEDICNYSNISFMHSALTPQRASKTLNSKLGDCKDLSVLFVSMAKEVGLDANLVLVSTRDQGENYLSLPSIGFNHCIAQLRDNGKNYFIELTDKNLSFSSLDNSDVKSLALEIPKDGTETNSANLRKLNASVRPENNIIRNTTLVVNGNKADITRKSIRIGAEASVIRHRYKNLSVEDCKKNLQKGLNTEFSNQVSLKEYNIKNLDNLSDSLWYNYSFIADKYVNEIAGMQVIKLPWNDAISNLDFLSLEKREYPLCMWKYSSTETEKETIKVTIPANKKLVEVPTNVNFKNDAISYSLTFELKGTDLIAVRELKYIKEVIQPSEYNAYKEMISKIAEADAKQFAFK